MTTLEDCDIVIKSGATTVLRSVSFKLLFGIKT